MYPSKTARKHSRQTHDAQLCIPVQFLQTSAAVVALYGYYLMDVMQQVPLNRAGTDAALLAAISNEVKDSIFETWFSQNAEIRLSHHIMSCQLSRGAGQMKGTNSAWEACQLTQITLGRLDCSCRGLAVLIVSVSQKSTVIS